MPILCTVCSSIKLIIGQVNHNNCSEKPYN